jgi:Cft2 family RNA processing exonuclease
MSWIKAAGETLLYTGDFKLRIGLSAERCEPKHADVLIMETTYGRPQYLFPPTNEVIQGVIRFCRKHWITMRRRCCSGIRWEEPGTLVRPR